MTADRPDADGRPSSHRRLDRHLFASNASPYNLAWETYGWTEGLDRTRARRLEERVPWGTELADSADPPVLVHGGGVRPAVNDPVHGTFGLPESFLPLDGRLGFCLSGVVRPRSGEPRARRARIATHTLLFDEGLFREIDGFPQGLHMDLSALPIASEAAWFAELRGSAPVEPSPLPPPERPHGTERFRRARLCELDRLRAAVAGAGTRAAKEALCAVYRAMGDVLGRRRGDMPREDADSRAAKAAGVIPVGPLSPTADAPDADALLRLAWLSLPLADRARVFYSMLDVRGRRPTPCLVPLAADSRKGANVGKATDSGIRIEPGRAADSAVREAPATELDPVRRWATLVLEMPADHARVSARIDLRSMSLFRPECLPYFVQWEPSRPGRVDIFARARMEAAGAKRWRGLGRLAAADLAARPAGQWPEWAKAVSGNAMLGANPRFFDGLARGSCGWVAGREAGRLAAVAGTGAEHRGHGLALLVEGLRALVQAGADVGELGRAVRRTRELDGEAVVAELASMLVALLRVAGREAEVPEMVDVARVQDPIAPGLASELVAAFLGLAERASSAWRPLLERAWLGVVASEAADAGPDEQGLGVLQRLAWAERRARGDMSLAALAAKGVPGAADLARRLVEPARRPPLSVFLGLMSALAGRRA